MHLPPFFTTHLLPQSRSQPPAAAQLASTANAATEYACMHRSRGICVLRLRISFQNRRERGVLERNSPAASQASTSWASHHQLVKDRAHHRRCGTVSPPCHHSRPQVSRAPIRCTSAHLQIVTICSLVSIAPQHLVVPPRRHHNRLWLAGPRLARRKRWETGPNIQALLVAEEAGCRLSSQSSCFRSGRGSYHPAPPRSNSILKYSSNIGPMRLGAKLSITHWRHVAGSIRSMFFAAHTNCSIVRQR
jgi:hypothetical protein